MGKARNWLVLLLLAAACVVGCSQSDAEKLSRIAQKTGDKLDRLSGGVRRKVSGGWQAVRGSLGDATLNSRVATRIKWDRVLAETDIQVKSAGPGVVELTGRVADEEQHQRAVQLANETDGVTSVKDSLQVAGR
jgi:osmotically-inducible protein OsmY